MNYFCLDSLAQLSQIKCPLCSRWLLVSKICRVTDQLHCMLIMDADEVSFDSVIAAIIYCIFGLVGCEN